MTADPASSTTLRALRVLEAVAKPGGPHRLGDIARDAAITKPSTHRILSNLAAAGYVVSDGGGVYGTGPRAHALSAQIAATSSEDHDAVLRRFQAIVDQTVHIALRSGNHAIYVRKVAADGPYQMASRLGGHIPLHSSAIGKAILAHIDPDDRRAVLAGGLRARTSKTITDAGELEAQLGDVRSQGYAVDDEENEETIRCLAAPLLDPDGRAIGGISISTITFQVPMEKLLAHVPELLETARLLAPSYA